MPVLWDERGVGADSVVGAKGGIDPKPSVSVIIPGRNEHPQVISTLLSAVEELEFWGYPYEVIVVSNQSTDAMPDVLEKRFQHWIKEKRLKVIRFDQRPSCWHARNVGVEAATGEVLIVMDAHMSISVGTLHGMIQLWKRHGGLWHSASQMWGDPKNTRLYGYGLQIKEKFWGRLSRYIPPQVFDGPWACPYTISMAQYSLFLLGREEFNEVRGFHPEFRIYGGGEPYFAMKWWLLGKKCWMYPRGLVRHAFGLRYKWQDAREDQVGKQGYREGMGLGTIEMGDRILTEHRGYAWNNRAFTFNFLLAAYVCGGQKWLDHMHQTYRKQRKEAYYKELDEVTEEAYNAGQEMRSWLETRQVMDLDELLKREPWNDFSVERAGVPG